MARPLPKDLGGDTARIIGKYVDSDVLTEARKRIRHIMDTHDTIIVGFSGGKDSLVVLHLVRQIQLERGITAPVKVWFYDEELIPDQVIDFVNEYRQLDWIDLIWLCVPLKSSKFILGDNHDYIQWDPARRHVRPMPEWATTLDDLGISARAAAGLTQYDMNMLEARLFKGKIAHLTGIRASESIVRYRASVNKVNENYINSSGHPRVSLCKPIFDWQENDVFRFFYDNGIRYCPLYDAQIWARQDLRVSTPLHAEASKRFAGLRAASPTFYDQVIDVFPEMAVQERYWGQQTDRRATIDTLPQLERWIRDTITDPQQRALALKRFRSVSGRHERDPENYPLQHIVNSFLTGAHKREIMSPGKGKRRTPNVR